MFNFIDKMYGRSPKWRKVRAEHIENNSYFSLVLEAYYNAAFAGRLYITEKSLRPMMWRKPFILIGTSATPRP